MAFCAAPPDGSVREQHPQVPRLDAETLRFLEHLPLPCRLVGDRGRVLWESRALRRLLHTKADAGCCESLGFLHRDGGCPSLRTIRTAVGQAQTRWLGRVYLALHTTPVLDPGGAELLSFECFQDVTTEKKLETAFTQQQELLESINRAMIEINQNLATAQQELQFKNESLEQANRQLRSLDQLKDEFLSIVSHELKAPLTSIKGSVELIQRCDAERLSSTGGELLAICRRNIDRLSGLVQDLLDVARIQSGRLSLDFTHFDLAGIVDEALQSQQALAAQRGLTLTNDCPAGLGIEADRDRLVQVLVNLVSNGIKFTDQGGVTVTAAAGAGEVTLRVADSGIGIAPEAQTTVFDRFVQVPSVQPRNRGGTGLGLSIVRGIVREHGGAVHVESAPGRGSSFVVRIPQPPGRDCHAPARPLD